MIEILHRHTKAVLYRSETAADMKTAVEEAVKSNADLSWSDLRGADLSWSKLRGADLSGADLRGAELSGAELSGAKLRGADLSGADLRGAELSGANLSVAELRWSDLRGANLSGAELSGANLSVADLRGANLSGADSARLSIVPEFGCFTGWKKCQNGVIVRLLIPDEARRSNATGRKCRAEFVDVIEVIGAETGLSNYDNGKTKYVTGQRVICDNWNEDQWVECGGGIHFFITRAEAEEYVLL